LFELNFIFLHLKFINYFFIRVLCLKFIISLIVNHTSMKKLIRFYLIVFVSIFLICSSFTNWEAKTKQIIKVYSEADYNIMIVDKHSMNFGVSKKKPQNADFYTNSNFFSKNNTPIGLVVINGKTISRKVKGGGYFFVKNGMPYVKAKICINKPEYSSQSILWAIDDGMKNKKLFNNTNGQKKVYRTIIGENSNGDIIVISSTRFGLVSIKEIVDFAEKKGMTEGILLDGGSSVDYKFSDGNNILSLNSVPHELKPLLDIDEPTTYIYGNLKP